MADRMIKATLMFQKYVTVPSDNVEQAVINGDLDTQASGLVALANQGALCNNISDC